MQHTKPTPSLTLGPLYFHWSAEKRRDFYFRVADEAAVDVVYVGEAVCSKREPFFEEYLPEVVDRLKAAEKQVVVSTLALITGKREVDAIKSLGESGFIIEANDVSGIHALGGKPFVVGPFINVFNEGARDFLIGKGAKRIVLPVELTAEAIGVLTDKKVETEILVFGRQPLSVSMRCYHARSHGLHKDNCQFACGLDPDGLPVDTIDGQRLLTVNGTQTMSHGYVVLLRQLADLRRGGVTHFRLSPQNVDMPRVVEIYRDVMDEKLAPIEAEARLKRLTSDVPYINGYVNGREGLAWVE